jgi:hypothetical protein
MPRTRKSPQTISTPSKEIVAKSEIAKPTEDLLPFSVYRNDWINRWNIHHYEMQELVRDLKKVVDFLTPYYNKMLKRVKELQIT